MLEGGIRRRPFSTVTTVMAARYAAATASLPRYCPREMRGKQQPAKKFPPAATQRTRAAPTRGMLLLQPRGGKQVSSLPRMPVIRNHRRQESAKSGCYARRVRGRQECRRAAKQVGMPCPDRVSQRETSPARHPQPNRAGPAGLYRVLLTPSRCPTYAMSWHR